ncbi:glycine-rich domain-containing protein [Lysinibacillus sp. TE18511]
MAEIEKTYLPDKATQMAIKQRVDEINTKSDQIKQGVNDLNTKVAAIGNKAVNGFARFTTPGAATWTAPEGVKFVKLTMFGAGGAGGGAHINTNNQAAGAGGGGGAFIIDHVIEVVPGQTYDLFVGLGGVPTEGSHGGNGGASIAFGFTCNGGSGGVGSFNNSATPITPGGTVSSGNVVSKGAYGGLGMAVNENYATYRIGGNTPKAVGGHSAFIVSGYATGGGGGAGYGGGGYGGTNTSGNIGGFGAGGGGGGVMNNGIFKNYGGYGGNGIIEIVW